MDIVERLRNCEESSMGGEGIFKLNYKILTEAANEIERLREALRWIERHPVEESKQWEVAVKEMKRLAHSALQQKDVSQMTRMHDSYAQMSVDKGKP